MALRVYDYDDRDRIEIEGEPCPVCRSDRTSHNRAFDIWKCEDCSTVWPYSPDYQRAEASDLDTRLTAHIEASMTLHELKREMEGKS